LEVCLAGSMFAHFSGIKLMKKFLLFIILLAGFVCSIAQAQTVVADKPKSDAQADTIAKDERFSWHLQFTTIGQYHPDFNSPYAGKNSQLSDEPTAVSVTATLFAGLRLWKGGSIFFNPELSGGKGLGMTLGIAGFPNGETYRVGSPEPVITVGRIYFRQTFNLSKDYTNVESDQNTLRGRISKSRLVLTLGKFSITDMFDANSYSHDPRTQFMNWSLMSAGAWDYPANTRGYTYGAVLELIKPTWGIKLASTMVPEVANGAYLDMNIGNAHSETLELDKQINVTQRPGVLRLIGYNTFAYMGNYEEATNISTYGLDITKTREYGRTKSGFVVNVEQELTDNLGMFGRYSWNDGKNETWAFTEIDRSLQLGIQSKGNNWKRKDDVCGAAVVINGLSDDHANYLAAGGYGFIIGDGKLNYGYESILELYYGAYLFQNFWLSPDYQFILNPAYNKDRGPINVFGVRAHVAF